jgi:hypothetical protein
VPIPGASRYAWNRTLEGCLGSTQEIAGGAFGAMPDFRYLPGVRLATRAREEMTG